MRVRHALTSPNLALSFPAALAARLASLGARAERASLVELATALLGLRDAPSPALARRLVASALGVEAASLDDPLALAVARSALAAAPAPSAEAVPWAPSASLRATPLARVEMVVVDLETTGGAASSTILEIGAVRVAGGAIVDVFQTLVSPGAPIPLAIQVLTGIHDRMVEGAPALPEAMARFTGWLAHAPDAPFVAHNAPFDEGFVRRALALCGLPPLARAVLCTRRLARRLVPELARFGLDSLCERFTIENRARHRALGDARATAELLLLLLQRAEQRAGARSLGDLLDLHAASVRAARRIVGASTLAAPPPADFSRAPAPR